MRLIDADALKRSVLLYATEPVKMLDRRWDTRCTAIIADMMGTIDMAPTIDAEPVVRCRDCKYWDTGWKPSGHPKDTHWCSMTDTFPCGDWFCADGKRRDGGDT